MSWTIVAIIAITGLAPILGDKTPDWATKLTAKKGTKINVDVGGDKPFEAVIGDTVHMAPQKTIMISFTIGGASQLIKITETNSEPVLNPQQPTSTDAFWK